MKTVMFRLTLFLAFVLFLTIAYAQKRTVNGSLKF